MAIKKKTEYGGITISDEAVAKVAGEAASSCYGVMGLVPKKGDPNYWAQEITDKILGKKEFVQGVTISKMKNGYDIDVYIIVIYGVKLTEVINEVQKKVSYDLKKTFPIDYLKVNVFIQDIQTVE